MTHTGKIARLPHQIREELNLRLLNGELVAEILRWLNSHPKVLQILQAQFHGKPMSHANLSNWRKDGFAEWLSKREPYASINKTLMFPPSTVETLQGGLVDHMAVILASHMLARLKDLPPGQADEETTKQWREMRITLASMRQYEFYSRKLKLEEARAQARIDAEAEPEETMSPEQKEEAIKRALGVDGPSWDNFAKRWVGPGASERVEKDEIEAQVRQEMARRKAERARNENKDPSAAQTNPPSTSQNINQL